MKNFDLLDEFYVITKRDKEWSKIAAISRVLYRYFSYDNRENLLKHLIEFAQNRKLTKTKKRLIVDLFHSLIFNSHNMDDLITPYSLFKKSVDDMMALDLRSSEFKKKYSFFKLLVVLRNNCSFENPNVFIDHLKRYRNLKQRELQVLGVHDLLDTRYDEHKIHGLYLILDKMGVDISFEYLLYVYVLDRKSMDKQLKKFLSTYNPQEMIEYHTKKLSVEKIELYDNIDEENILNRKVLEYLESYNSLNDKMRYIQDILNKYNYRLIKETIDGFIKQIAEDEKDKDQVKSFSYTQKGKKKILNIEVYRTYVYLKWDRNKYIHKVISYCDDLKKHPKYKDKFPYYIITEGSGYNRIYYAKNVPGYIPASAHFTKIEFAISEIAENDLRSLGLYNRFEIILKID